jgi:hypothetical protein
MVNNHYTMVECALQTSVDCFDVKKPDEVTPMCTPNRRICLTMRQSMQGDTKMQPASDCHALAAASARRWWCWTLPSQDGIGGCSESRIDCELTRPERSTNRDTPTQCALQASVACLTLRGDQGNLVPLCLPTQLTCNMARKALPGDVPRPDSCQTLGVRDENPWWCATFPRAKGGYCDRDQSQCEKHRAAAAPRDKTTSQCTPQRNAHCFGSQGMDRVTAPCFPSASVCTEQHDHGVAPGSVVASNCYLAD